MDYPNAISEVIKSILKKAETDKQYRNKLFERPKDVLREKDIFVPDAVEIRVYMDSENNICIKPVIDLPNEVWLRHDSRTNASFW